MAPLLHNSQVTFAGGEFSPEMYSRIDLAKYATGLKTGRNGFVPLQGGFSNRSGFRYVAAAKYSDKACRLIPFEFSDTQSYMLEVGHLYIRFYVNGAQILLSGLPYEIVTPYTEDDIWGIKYTQSADTVYFAHQSFAPQTLVRQGDTNWTLSAFLFVNGPFRVGNTTDTTLNFTNIPITIPQYVLSASNPVFNPAHVGSLWQLNSPIPSQSITKAFSSSEATFPILCGGTYRISSTGTWTGQFVIEQSTDKITWTAISQTFASADDFNINTSGTVLQKCYLRANCTSFSSGTLNLTLSSDAFTLTNVFQVASYLSPISVSLNPPSAGSIGVDSGISIGFHPSLITTDWAEGAWSTFRGWPGAVAFFQDRLGWASTPDNPVGSWWSATGDYVNYGVSDPLVDSDAISVNMPTRKFNSVQHLLPMYVILGLTSSGEISIGPGASGDFSPTSIDLRPQTYHGASRVPPVIVGNEAIFVQARSSQVRSISYQYFTNIFTGQILNLMSSHLFRNFSLQDMTFAESPDSSIFAVRSDGVLLCFTYLPEQQMMAWTHWDTAGTFESCSVIPAGTYDELWVVVNRANGRFIERLAQRLPTTDTQDQFHVDCGIDYNGAPVTGISGLDFLNGQSVICLADGNVQGPFTVVNGSIALTTAASLVHIGLPYTSDVETLNVEQQSQDGTSQGRRQRVAQVTLRFSNSLGGYIGPSADKLHALIPSPPPTLDSYRPLFTGDVTKISIPPDWKSNGRIFFRQTDPLPFTLTGIFPITESGNI